MGYFIQAKSFALRLAGRTVRPVRRGVRVIWRYGQALPVMVSRAAAIVAHRLNLPEWWHLLSGIWSYVRTGETPGVTFLAMRTLFCRTNGRSNDLFHLGVRIMCPRYQLPEPVGVLGHLTPERLTETVAYLRERGYSVFPGAIGGDVCDRLEHFARSAPCDLWPPPTPDPGKVCYDGNNPLAATYFLGAEDVINNPDVQDLVTDPSILVLAQSYLGCRPALASTTIWWSPTFKREADAAAAQLYHFDMDQLRFVKFFFYLRDVATENGPHCYVSGSHLRSKARAPLVRRGPVRIPDADIAAHLPKEALREFCGPRGTIIVEDTIGFHKGKPPQAGERLLLEMSFSGTLFGSPYRRPRVRIAPGSRLGEYLERYPAIYSRLVTDPIA